MDEVLQELLAATEGQDFSEETENYDVPVEIFNGRNTRPGTGTKRHVFLQVYRNFQNVIKELDGSELKVFMTIMLHINDKGWCWPTVKQIASMSDIREDTAQQAINRLTTYKIDGRRVLLRINLREKGGAWGNNRYMVFPSEADEARFADFERIGDAKMVKPPTPVQPRSVEPTTAEPTTVQPGSNKNHSEQEPISFLTEAKASVTGPVGKNNKPLVDANGKHFSTTGKEEVLYTARLDGESAKSFYPRLLDDYFAARDSGKRLVTAYTSDLVPDENGKLPSNGIDDINIIRKLIGELHGAKYMPTQGRVGQLKNLAGSSSDLMAAVFESYTAKFKDSPSDWIHGHLRYKHKTEGKPAPAKAKDVLEGEDVNDYTYPLKQGESWVSRYISLRDRYQNKFENNDWQSGKEEKAMYAAVEKLKELATEERNAAKKAS